MAYPPDYRYFSASDKHYVKNYGCTCIGAIVVVIVLGVFAALPSIFDGASVMLGNPIMNFFSIMLWFAPFIALGLFVKIISNYREKKEQERLLTAAEE
jgi:hypothetical protein